MINIKNNDNKCFLWCHNRHSSPLKIHPERVTNADKNTILILIVQVSKKDFGKKEKKNNKFYALICFIMKIIWFILFTYQMKNLKIV